MDNLEKPELGKALEEVGIEPAHYEDVDYLSPNVGGCWICLRGGAQCFDMEFDTYYHEDCLEKIPDCDSILDFEKGGWVKDALL